MKRTIIITGMALVILAALTGRLDAQRGMRGMHMHMRHPIAVGDSLRMNMMRQHGDSLLRGGMHHRIHRGAFGNPMGPGMGPLMRGRPGAGQMPGFRGEIWQTNPRGMRRAYFPGPGFGMRHGMMPGRPGMKQPRPGMRILETIPNLTEKQKKDIADLRQKQMEEMKKMREEMSAKMNDMHEANRTKIMNIFTDEQKKYFEGNNPAVQEKK
jgi:hypothetical protein